MKNRIYLSSPTMHDKEMVYIQEAFDTNWVAPLGNNVNCFEKEIASYIGIESAAALVSGTAALHLALKLAKVGTDDIVLCSDLTFSATVNPVSYENGIQVFVDAERETWNMDPRALEKALKKYPEAKAVIVANLYGVPAKLDEIKELCKHYQVVLIEDAAESLGATYKERQTGTFGDYSALSFNGNKIITTSGGGMFLSHNSKASDKVRFWATQSRDPAFHYEHSEIGYNYRMSNIVAGIGRGQLHYLDEHVQRKTHIYNTYKEALKDLPLSMNPYEKGISSPNFWLSCVLLDENIKTTPEDIMRRLESENIESRPIWKPMHLQPVFQHRDFIQIEKNDVANDIFRRGLCLPSDIKMSEEDQERIINIVKSCF